MNAFNDIYFSDVDYFPGALLLLLLFLTTIGCILWGRKDE